VDEQHQSNRHAAEDDGLDEKDHVGHALSFVKGRWFTFTQRVVHSIT
jgi:hypothetical protein